MANTYQNELPPTCVNDLDKAAKIGLRILNEKENQLLLSKGMYNSIKTSSYLKDYIKLKLRKNVHSWKMSLFKTSKIWELVWKMPTGFLWWFRSLLMT